MADHRHENYEIYGSASVEDTQTLRSYIDGLRQDLDHAEDRISELEVLAVNLAAAGHAVERQVGDLICEMREHHG